MHIVVLFPANKLARFVLHAASELLFRLIRLLSDLKCDGPDGLHLSHCSLEGLCLGGFLIPEPAGI